MIKDSLISPVPATAVRPSEPRLAGGRVEPPAQLPGGNELPRREVAEVPDRDLSTVVSSLNDYAQNVKRELQFSMDETSGRTVITVRDSESDEIIRQIPPESAIALESYLRSEGRLESFGLLEKA
jgi:flagellar protein FlaG